MNSKLLTAALTLGLSLTLGADLALAQGNGRGQGNADRDRVEEREGDWSDVLRGQRDTRVSGQRGNGSGKVPPGWCRGKGNPHNTVENCGYQGQTVYGSDRVGDRNDRGGSYEQAHENFHWELDRRYEDLAARRPLDITYQLQLRAQKQREHQEWHARMGVGH